MPDAPMLGASKKVKLQGPAFEARFHGPLVHQSVRAEQAARRRGTAATKTRAMVSGGGAKPWRQKGTGRARAGSTRSPIWTGGGVAFGPHPRSYTFKVNRKEHRAALRSALSLHASRASIAIFDPGAFAKPKTSQALDLLEDWAGAERPTLVVLGSEERDAALSFRNLPRVAVLTPEDVGVADLLGAASLLLTQPALDALAARVDASGDAASTGASEAKAAKDEAPAAKAPEPKPAAAKPAAAKAPAAKPAAAKPAAAKTSEPKAAAAKAPAAKPAAKPSDGDAEATAGEDKA